MSLRLLNVAKSHSLFRFNNSLKFRAENLLDFSCRFCSLFCLCEHPTALCRPINCSFLHCDSWLLRGESCTMHLLLASFVKFIRDLPCCWLCEWWITHGGRFLLLSFVWKEVSFWVRSWNEKLLCSGRAHWNMSTVSRSMQLYSAVTKWEDSKSCYQR